VSRIVVLGSSSGMPDSTRACSSILIETNNNSYLIDVGEGCASSIIRHNIDPEKIGQVFVTHTHSDHSMGIFMLVQMMHLLKRKKNLDIYLPEEALFWFENMFDAVYLFQDNLSFGFELKPINIDFVYQDEDLILKAFPNQHLLSNEDFIKEQSLTNKMESYCFLIEIDGKRIVYSGDIAGIEDIESQSEGVDFLLCESTHIKVEELVELASRKKVKSTILTHIHDSMDKDKTSIVMMGKKHAYKNIVFAYDGLCIDIK